MLRRACRVTLVICTLLANLLCCSLSLLQGSDTVKETEQAVLKCYPELEAKFKAQQEARAAELKAFQEQEAAEAAAAQAAAQAAPIEAAP